MLKLTQAVEDLAKTQGETLSRMTAILVEEALTVRGLNPKHQTHLPPEWTDTTDVAAQAAAQVPGVEVKQVMRRTAPSDEAQMMKLKLMQELMEQLKSM